jgi:hypothetical protein
MGALVLRQISGPSGARPQPVLGERVCIAVLVRAQTAYKCPEKAVLCGQRATAQKVLQGSVRI